MQAQLDAAVQRAEERWRTAYADRDAFLNGNDTQYCPTFCDYENSLFKGQSDPALWGTPTMGCATFVSQDVLVELVFASVVCGTLILVNLIWGCTESTCFDEFNRS